MNNEKLPPFKTFMKSYGDLC